MATSLRMTLATTSLLALAACGSGGSDSNPNTTPADNGLPFGAAGQSLEDAEGVEITAQAASVQAGDDPEIGPGTITLDMGFIGGNGNGTLRIFGQTVPVTNGAGTLSGGEEVRVFYDDGRSGDYAGVIDIVVTGSDGINDIDGETTYVFGFETNPGQMGAVSGGATFEGGFQVAGFLNGDPLDPEEYEGSITVEVLFNGEDADVTLEGDLGITPVDLSGSGLAINGNSFTGTLTCDLGCTGNGGTVDATFYGPSAAEVGGVLSVDLTDLGGGMDDFDGVGGFVIGRAPAP